MKNKAYTMIETLIIIILTILSISISFYYTNELIDKFIAYQMREKIINIVESNNNMEFNFYKNQIIVNKKIYYLNKRLNYSFFNDNKIKIIKFNKNNYSESFSIFIKNKDNKLLSKITFSNNNPLKIYILSDKKWKSCTILYV